MNSAFLYNYQKTFLLRITGKKKLVYYAKKWGQKNFKVNRCSKIFFGKNFTKNLKKTLKKKVHSSF